MSNQKRKNSDPGALQTLFNRLALTWRLMFDGRVSISNKIIPLLTVLYLVSPIDIIPDILLPFGVVDDIGLAVLALEFFIRMAPEGVVREHLQRLQNRTATDHFYEEDEDIIDGEYRVNDR